MYTIETLAEKLHFITRNVNYTLMLFLFTAFTFFLFKNSCVRNNKLLKAP